MRFTVSTVKDTVPHLQRFVAGNLAGGIDHLVVVLDAPDDADQAEGRAWLQAQPHVTCVLADDAWWAGDRPDRLNVRQRVHANLVRQLLADVPGAEWVFHVDADEIVDLDPEAMAAVPDDVVGIRLVPWETVARRRWEGEPTLFKTLLDDDDLALLATLGVIDAPTNWAYFHGHVDGKSGVRPGAPVWMTLHRVVDAAREPVTVHGDERLRVRHYESYSGEEFVRKWLAMVGSGASASFRPRRGDIAEGLRTLVAKDLPVDATERLLLRLFDRLVADDEQVLADLGLLRHAEPAAGTHVPALLDAEAAAALANGLARVREVPKRRFQNAAAAAAFEHEQVAERGESEQSPPLRRLLGRRRH